MAEFGFSDRTSRRVVPAHAGTTWRIGIAPKLYDLKKLLAASFEARFLVTAACNRSISRGHQRDPLVKFLDRQQREVLPDLVGDFLSRLVVVLDGHMPYSVLEGGEAVASERRWLIRCLFELDHGAVGLNRIMI